MKLRVRLDVSQSTAQTGLQAPKHRCVTTAIALSTGCHRHHTRHLHGLTQPPQPAVTAAEIHLLGSVDAVTSDCCESVSGAQ